MPKAILVPVDFTPVSLNALHFACALRNDAVPDIVAVHLLDPKIAGAGVAEASVNNPALQKVFKHMQAEILEKTSEDLQNFVQQQQSQGFAIRPRVAFGTIYDSFAGIADDESAVLTIMGTHGIVGMQHLMGSRAYKTVVQANRPFLVMQSKPYSAPMRSYLVFRDRAQLLAGAKELIAMADCFPGELLINVLSGATELPQALRAMANRITMISEPLSEEQHMLDRATEYGANALGFCIDETEDNDAGIFGLSQSRIMSNERELPVLCLCANDEAMEFPVV